MSPDNCFFDRMKRIIHSIAFILLSLSISGCATSGYLTDRGNDALDILTLTIDTGCLTKFRMGPLAVGLGGTNGSVGLRGGTLIAEPTSFCGNGMQAYDLSFLGFANSEACTTKKMQERRKEILAGNPPFDTMPLFREEEYQYSYPLYQHSNVNNPSYYTDIEFFAGFIFSLRMGFNPGELLDFVLGWTTVDIYGDDIGIVEEKARKKSNEGSADRRSASSALRTQSPSFPVPTAQQ